MDVLIYDGSWSGLLCCLSAALRSVRRPQLISRRQRYQANLFSPPQCIATDENAARAFWEYLRARLSEHSLQTIVQGYWSDTPQSEIRLLRYIEFALEKGPSVSNFLTDERVGPMEELARKVGREAHRLKGLLRFQETADGRFYARVRPDHNVVPQLAAHFKHRLADRCWIIHDVRRNLAAIYNKQYWEMVDIVDARLPQLSEQEAAVSGLWRQYFQHSAIADRVNPRLQRQNLPRRYWEFLTEHITDAADAPVRNHGRTAQRADNTQRGRVGKN